MSLANQEVIASADAVLREGRCKVAIGQLRHALAADPGDIGVRVQLGRAYLCAGQDGAAASLFDQVLRQQPANRLARLELARTLSRRRRYAEANQLYRQLLDLDANDEAASLGLIETLVRQERFQEASQELSAALVRHPNSLGLLQYEDALATGAGAERPVEPDRLVARLQTTPRYLTDSAGNKSAVVPEQIDWQVTSRVAEQFQAEQYSLWSGGLRAQLYSYGEQTRFDVTRWLAATAGAGQIRFPDRRSRSTYRSELRAHVQDLSLTAGFGRTPVVPTLQAADLDLSAEGWQAAVNWLPDNWRLQARWSRQHYTDSNRRVQADGTLFRWMGSRGLAVGAGYSAYRLHFSQPGSSGYFSPDYYFSQMGLGGLRFAFGQFRAEYLAGTGTESYDGVPRQFAWQGTARHSLLLGQWTVSGDYQILHLAQNSSGSGFRAQGGRLAIAYRF